MVEPPADYQVPSDKDAITSTPRGDGQHILVTANTYAENSRTEWNGALLEETSAFRSDIELFYDLHTLVWDPELGETLAPRNDAVTSDVSWESSTVPELHLTNDLRFGDGTTATLEQDVIASVDRCALLVRNRASFADARQRTLFTLFNLGIKGHSHDDPHGVQDAAVRHEDDCDVLVANDGERYVAFAQVRDGTRRFDGHRIGAAGRSHGSDRSTWTDVYEENDGWIDSTEEAIGDLDAGFGLYVDSEDYGDKKDGDTEVEWLTVMGFAMDEKSAVDHARESLDAGYDSERREFVDAWESWHEGVGDAPTGDPKVDDLYERSLTSMKCAQDGCCAMVAGAFKPEDMTYKFIWPRDQVIIIQSLVAAGATEEAEIAIDWLDRVQITDETYDDRGIDRRGTWWQNYYTTGEPHWRALQLDQVGGPIYAHWLAWSETGDDGLLEKHYEMSRRAAEFLLEYDNDWGFPRKHQDPWEEVWGYSTEGTAAAIAGLRCMAAMADARGENDFAETCRERADTWASNLETYCFKQGTPYGDHYVTADSPEYGADPAPDTRPDAASFMAYWPWNVLSADDSGLAATSELVEHSAWRATGTPCLGRYPGDHYTPSGAAEDGGWPLCEAYADVVRWQNGQNPDAVSEYLFEHANEWTTSASLLPERVDGDGTVSWNSNLQWSQAMYILLAESHARGEPFGLAPRS
ncbi:glycoside hydrolase family 15 protein [Salinigranum halophilum]|uniref:glycoside hydrolase family 15 protein n=1 Tax=Salinigranum halophilum TaxID=2565931 RepID=UPI0010A78D10|nr:glycoside hydrolase family 15 protein [Salinigranum halophilum]